VKLPVLPVLPVHGEIVIEGFKSVNSRKIKKFVLSRGGYQSYNLERRHEIQRTENDNMARI